MGDLEVDQDLRFQRREWVAQRVGWALALLLILLAVLGFLGPGLLMHASQRDGPLAVDFDRVVRRGGDSDVTVHVAAAAVTGPEVTILVGEGFLADVRVDAMTPEPDTATRTPRGVAYRFSATPGRDFVVELALTADALWTSHGLISVPGEATVEFRQFFVP